jgi:hypothetical protein
MCNITVSKVHVNVDGRRTLERKSVNDTECQVNIKLNDMQRMSTRLYLYTPAHLYPPFSISYPNPSAFVGQLLLTYTLLRPDIIPKCILHINKPTPPPLRNPINRRKIFIR